jgi:hypothetical protein
MNTQFEKMTARELFIIKSALHLLAEKNHQEMLNGDTLASRDFDAIATLEKSFVIAYQEKVSA